MRKLANKAERGYSLLEAVVVLGMIAVVSAIAIMQTVGSTSASKADAAMNTIITTLRTGRQIAVTKRRNVLVTFTAPNEIQLAVETLPGEAAAAVIPPVYLNDGGPGGQVINKYYVYPGLPDTPMGFGNATALDFTPASGGTAGLAIMYTTQGSLVGTTTGSGYNTVGNSNPVNASIFIAVPGQKNTARAVTVFGATGRVRSYTWIGTSWQENQ